jgi:hypothetical protein
MTAIVWYMGQDVRWCDWPVTHNSRYRHDKSANIFCLNPYFLSQFLLKWNFYQHICLSVHFLLVSSNYFKLWKSTFTSWHGTTMLKCRDWKWSRALSGKMKQSIIHLLAEHSPCDYRLNIGPKLNVQKSKVLGCVTICDRQLCVECQCFFILEGTDSYCLHS